MSAETHGTYDSRFEAVAELFARQSAENPAGGASLAIFKDGKPVVNLWRGESKPGQAWTEDTISDVFSCTKGIISIIAASLVERGLLDLDVPVANYWPEFGQAGKAQIQVKTLLRHRAGLSAPRKDISRAELLDEHTVVEELAKQVPLWEPDSNYGYHALTFGHLVSKLIHSVTGLTANDYLQKFVTAPMGVDMWIGLPAKQLHRVATLVGDGNFKSMNPDFGSDQYWVEKAMTFGGALPTDPTDAGGFNDPETLGIELAGANGVTNAYGLAKIYSAAVIETEGVRLVGDEALEVAIQPASFGMNVWHEPAPHPVWGNGFMLAAPPHFELPGGRGFGHNGLGGQAGWASMDERVGFGYTTSYLRNSSETQTHQQELVKALQKVLSSH
jgi:CubicO group peptidase (beta-lactamase class C family)